MADSKPSTLIPETGFGIANILGLIFLLIGFLLIISLQNFKLPIDLKNFDIILQYGAALGSILGGLSMLLKKKESTPEIRTK
jgi:hypothetical protein